MNPSDSVVDGGNPAGAARSIEPGDLVWARNVTGVLLPRRAITGPMSGHDFPVIWVCAENAYEESRRHLYPPERGDFDAPGAPWPMEDVTPRG